MHEGLDEYWLERIFDFSCWVLVERGESHTQDQIQISCWVASEEGKIIVNPSCLLLGANMSP